MVEGVHDSQDDPSRLMLMHLILHGAFGMGTGSVHHDVVSQTSHLDVPRNELVLEWESTWIPCWGTGLYSDPVGHMNGR